jgi:hypothetical protein
VASRLFLGLYGSVKLYWYIRPERPATQQSTLGPYTGEEMLTMFTTGMPELTWNSRVCGVFLPTGVNPNTIPVDLPLEGRFNTFGHLAACMRAGGWYVPCGPFDITGPGQVPVDVLPPPVGQPTAQKDNKVGASPLRVTFFPRAQVSTLPPQTMEALRVPQALGSS